MTTALVTGSSGLVGSEAVTFLDARGWATHGVDNNMRRSFFGPAGDTTWNRDRLRRTARRFTHHEVDVRDRQAMLDLVGRKRPDLIIHCAAQPSHDLARDLPFDDFEVNATGTLNLLEAVRRYCPESPLVFLSTNKVYGDAPNEKPLVELETRYEFADSNDYHGIDETCRIDSTLHSLFGASKLAADILVQEYGRYFGIPTVCFRAGCLTGSSHSAVELHGFLARAFQDGRTYHIYGYQGKQVRDNLHAYDVCAAGVAFYENPRVGAVYNLGGGRSNSISVLEAIARFESLTRTRLKVDYVDQNRIGDHICYISDTRRFRTDYPQWQVTRSLEDVFDELAEKISVPA